MIIAVEGIDGSGKSSLIKKISETYENVYTFSSIIFHEWQAKKKCICKMIVV